MKSKSSKPYILVLGAGHFGTCLAQHLAKKGNEVRIWSRRQEVVEAINSRHINTPYLPESLLDERIIAVNELTSALCSSARLVVLAVPTQALRTVLLHWGKVLAEVPLVSVAKGIEVNTELFPAQIIQELCGNEAARCLVTLSGPSFAIEVASGQPTALSAASHDAKAGAFVQELFHAPNFRVYTCADPLGLEIAGALKNVIAIAAGACSGLGFMNNSRAALITRGLAELSRVGKALGASPQTFMGLGGVGDLFLTCSSEKSRNFRVGYLLAQGSTLPKVLQELGSVAEGVATAKAAHNMALRLKVEMPITHAVYEVLYEGKKVEKALEQLLNRDAKNELA